MTTNLTRDEAQSRTQVLDVSTYTVDIDVSNAETGAPTYLSRTVVEFTARTECRTFIDLIADSVTFAEINDEILDPAEVFDGARLGVPIRTGKNILTIEAQAYYSTSGEGLHRFTDPADGKVYLYTQYEPTDARRVFANFDQPDLKAEFIFNVTAPGHFQVLRTGPRRVAGRARRRARSRSTRTPPRSLTISLRRCGSRVTSPASRRAPMKVRRMSGRTPRRARPSRWVHGRAPASSTISMPPTSSRSRRPGWTSSVPNSTTPTRGASTTRSSFRSTTSAPWRIRAWSRSPTA